MWCHQMLKHLEVLLRLVYTVVYSERSDTRQHGLDSFIFSIAYIVWSPLCCEVWLWHELFYSSMRPSAVSQTLTAFVYDLTPIASFCPICCFSDSFWTVALSYVSTFHYSVSSLVSWTVLRAGLIMMPLSPSFSCRRALRDWKGVKFLQGKPCWFVPVILWSYEWGNLKLTGYFGIHVSK